MTMASMSTRKPGLAADRDRLWRRDLQAGQGPEPLDQAPGSGGRQLPLLEVALLVHHAAAGKDGLHQAEAEVQAGPREVERIGRLDVDRPALADRQVNLGAQHVGSIGPGLEPATLQQLRRPGDGAGLGCGAASVRPHAGAQANCGGGVEVSRWRSLPSAFMTWIS